MKHFDIIVIGKGLAGSAAAKYLAAAKMNVAVIGPDEPADYHDALVFASHYDQARVQRLIGKDEVWTRLNSDAVRQYPGIEAETGISFHQPVGCLYVNPYGTDDYLTNAGYFAGRQGLPFTSFNSGAALNRRFSDFDFPAASKGLFEATPAGYINPRLLIEAQLNILKKNSGLIFSETVINLSFIDGIFTMVTTAGNTFVAPRVLLATGSFLNCNNLIPRQIYLKTKSEVVLLAKLDAGEAKRLADLPSLLYEIDNGDTEGIYLIQPVLYPDGHYYVKMGCNMPGDIFFDSLEQVQQWFRYGDTSIFKSKLINALVQLMPNLQATGYDAKKCIISRTAHGRPYIGETLQRGLYLAGGCNGYSAMCADAIGSTAAHLILYGQMPEGYAERSFEIIYQ